MLTKSLATVAHVEAWSTRSFRTSWHESRNRPKLVAVIDEHRLSNYLRSLRKRDDFDAFLAAPVTGAISEGWKDLNIRSLLFQETLLDVASRWPGTWTPAEYLLQYAIDCKLKLPGKPKYDLGRSLRNLPSLLREYLLHDALLRHDVPCSLPTVEENAVGHADLWIHLHAEQIALWSFQATPRGFEMLQRKIKLRARSFESRNLFAPFHIQLDGESVCDWSMPSDDYVTRLVRAIREPLYMSPNEMKAWLGSSRNVATSFAFATSETLMTLQISG